MNKSTTLSDVRERTYQRDKLMRIKELEDELDLINLMQDNIMHKLPESAIKRCDEIIRILDYLQT